MKIALMAPIAVVGPSCTLANFQNKNEATSAGGGTVLETVHAAGRGTYTVFGNSPFLRRLTGNRWFSRGSVWALDCRRGRAARNLEV